VGTDPMPSYGTDGDPVDESIPVYGTPGPPVSEHQTRPPAAPPASIARRFIRTLRHRVRVLMAGDSASALDWSDYPGLVAGDFDDVLGGIRLDDVLERDDRVLSRVRRSLEAEFRVHWWTDADRESLEIQSNSWGGESLLQTVRSVTWRTTSGLTSVEDRDMAVRIVGVALTHEGLPDQQLERLTDEWVLTARSAGPPESVVTLRVGFSEFQATMDSSGVLAAEHEGEFRIRALPFARLDFNAE
jgi:hypothetical protein